MPEIIDIYNQIAKPHIPLVTDHGFIIAESDKQQLIYDLIDDSATGEEMSYMHTRDKC
jgi:hypothetical protein